MKVNRAEMLQHVERLRASNASVATYARERGIPYHRMLYWVRREAARCAPESRPESEPFVLVQAPTLRSGSCGVRLCLSQGAVLEFAPEQDPASVAAVCRMVLGC